MIDLHQNEVANYYISVMTVADIQCNTLTLLRFVATGNPVKMTFNEVYIERILYSGANI